MVCIGDGSKHASLVSAVGADQHIYTNAYLLKGKYPQVQILQSPFPAGVTVERLRGLHISMNPAGVENGIIFDFFLLSYLFITYLQIYRHRLSGI